MFKKKGMIDVVEMQRRGMVIAPKRDPEIDKFQISKDGYVEMKKDAIPVSAENMEIKPEISSFANFFESSSSSTSTESSSGLDLPGMNSGLFSGSSGSSLSSTSTADVYEKREVDERVEKLDNLIYKLEQRILELEKKLGVNVNSW
jgi:hypothetical protein